MHSHSFLPVTAGLVLLTLAATPVAAQTDGEFIRYVSAVDEFEDGSAGWLPGFSDYQLGQAGPDRIAEIRALPDEVDPGKRGYFLAADNPSTDTFMYLKKGFGASDGVDPDGLYRVDFLVNLVSNVSGKCFGLGGSPADVYLKVGVSPEEPVGTIEGRTIGFNLDKGQARDDGMDARTVDTIANGLPCEGEPRWTPVEQYQGFPQHIRPSADGKVWAFIGFDSAFSGRTEVYFDRIIVLLTRVQ